MFVLALAGITFAQPLAKQDKPKPAQISESENFFRVGFEIAKLSPESVPKGTFTGYAVVVDTRSFPKWKVAYWAYIYRQYKPKTAPGMLVFGVYQDKKTAEEYAKLWRERASLPAKVEYFENQELYLVYQSIDKIAQGYSVFNPQKPKETLSPRISFTTCNEKHFDNHLKGVIYYLNKAQIQASLAGTDDKPVSLRMQIRATLNKQKLISDIEKIKQGVENYLESINMINYK
jgi:hypothetical protein